MVASPSSPEVLYGDYNGHMRPLGRMYFSLDSRCLVADHPESVQEEVESHFCPHCNSLWHAEEAQSNGNRCLQCFECPLCSSVLATEPVSLEPFVGRSASDPPPSPMYCLRCLYCRWSSEDIGVVAPGISALTSVAAAGERKRESRAVFDGMLAAAKRRETDALRDSVGVGRRGGGRSGMGTGAGSVGVRSPFSPASLVAGMDAAGIATGPWKVADVEEVVSRRQKSMAEASRSVGTKLRSPLDPAVTSSGLERDTDGPVPALWGLSSGMEAPGLADKIRASMWGLPGTLEASGERGISGKGIEEDGRVSGVEGTVFPDEWPRRLRLRTRLGKRCRKDLAGGRAGILIKATFNPLEGDSSSKASLGRGGGRPLAWAVPPMIHRSQGLRGDPLGSERGVRRDGFDNRGKWFKKDCSAALLVPRLTVAALPSTSAFLRSPPGVDSEGDSSSPTASTRDSSGARGDRGLRQGCHPHKSLILRVANPQETLLRIRLAQEEVDGGASEGRVEGDLSGTGLPIGVTVRPRPPRRPEVKGEWAKLEGKEDEVFRQPGGDRHRLPEAALELAAALPDSDEIAPAGKPFVLHQLGDVAWVQLPIDDASAAVVTRAAGVSEDVAVTVRFLLVMGEEEGEDSGTGSEVQLPIAVRFRLSECPR